MDAFGLICNRPTTLGQNGSKHILLRRNSLIEFIMLQEVNIHKGKIPRDHNEMVKDVYVMAKTGKLL